MGKKDVVEHTADIVSGKIRELGRQFITACAMASLVNHCLEDCLSIKTF